MSKKVKCSDYIPQLIVTLISALLLGLVLKTYSWIKDYGDFASTAFVMQAKADCLDTSKKELQRHEDWEAGQLQTINANVNKILLLMAQEGVRIHE